MRWIVVVLIGLALAGCAGPADRSAPQTSDSSATTGESVAPGTHPRPEDPTLTAQPRPTSKATLQTLTGVVERSAEDRCTTLTTPNATWELRGTAASLSAGDRVTVRGRPDPDATTTCQRGPVLVVIEVERG